MKFTSKLLTVVSIFIGLCIITYVFFMVYLGFSINKAGKRGTMMIIENYKKSSFNGYISIVDNIQGIKCFISIDIMKDGKVNEQFILYPCKNKRLEAFMQSGDSIAKNKDDLMVKIIKKNGQVLITQLPLDNEQQIK
ncbi:MAG: hypothetical protein QM541_09075 [Flavobacterium sp.]|nr:hypothetical protein [Flavobacterium sp.]